MYVPAAIWLNYCQHGVKHQSINQSILLLPEYYKNVYVAKHVTQRQSYDHKSWLETGTWDWWCGLTILVSSQLSSNMLLNTDKLQKSNRNSLDLTWDVTQSGQFMISENNSIKIGDVAWLSMTQPSTKQVKFKLLQVHFQSIFTTTYVIWFLT